MAFLSVLFRFAQKVFDEKQRSLPSRCQGASGPGRPRNRLV